MRLDSNQQAFFALFRAGLWGKEVQLVPFGQIDFAKVLSLAQEQSVVGLIAAGLHHVPDTKVAKTDVLQFIGQSLQLEQQNTAMNYFIGVIVDKIREAGIYTLLVKGQGIAQCYDKPLWRSCGDVDSFLDAENYKKALDFLSSMAQSIDEENPANLHLGMTIDPWVVELHGTLRSGIGKRIDRELDAIQEATFKERRVRVWKNGDTDVLLPAADDDVIFVFSHILQHFFKGGIVLRQVCDWCRLLWNFRSEIDPWLLYDRLREMGILTEWETFAALAFDWLGMPKEAMPLYLAKKKWSKKAERVLSFILETGNFGHNRDRSYYEKYPVVVYKAISLWNNTRDSLRHLFIFLKDAFRVWVLRLREGVAQVVEKGREGVCCGCWIDAGDYYGKSRPTIFL